MTNLPPAVDAPPDTDVVRSAKPAQTVGHRRLRVAAVVCILAVATWVLATLLSVGHGFDESDEGFYLLSYRWWDVNIRTFSGSQYFYGPVFELLGHNIAALRAFRLVTILGAHVLFGWTFMRWLRLRRPRAADTVLWEVAGAAAIVAGGGMVYCWLPLSPGYNDLSLLGALLAGAAVLRAAADADRGTRTPAWVPLCLGALAFVMVMSKWSSSMVTLGVVGVIGIMAVWPRGVRAVGRLALWTVVGGVGMAAAFHLVVIPLTTVLGPMLSVNRLLASRTSSPQTLLEMYLQTTWLLVETMITVHWPVIVAAIVAVVARGRVLRPIAAGLVVLGGAISVWRMVDRGDLRGGTVNLEHFPVSFLLVASLALVIAIGVVVDRRLAATGSSLRAEGVRGYAVLAMVAMMPVAQAAGTSNAIYFMVINGFAAYVALMIAVLTGTESAPPAARGLVAVAVGGAVALSAITSTDANWSNPYRTPGRAETTTVPSGVPALASVRLDPLLAEQYSSLRRQLEPYIEPAGRAMMGFDELAGVILALDGRPVGEAWYSGRDRARTATGIRTECRTGEPWWGERAPILLFSRGVSEIEIETLRGCGLDLATDYQQLDQPEETLGLIIYVPTNEFVPTGRDS